MLAGIVHAGVQFSVARPVITLAVWTVVSVCCAWLGRALQIDEDVSAFLDTESSEWASYQDLVDVFGDDSFVTVVVPLDTSDPSSGLASVTALTAGFNQVKGVKSVESIATYNRLRRLDDSAISVRPLVDEEGRLCEGCRLVAVGDPYLTNAGLFSSKGDAAGILIRLDRDGAAERSEAIHAISSLALTESRGSLVSGVPVFRDAILTRTTAEFRKLGPVSGAAVAIVVLAALRSVIAVLSGLACGGVAIAVVVAVMGATGIPLSLTTFTLPAILLALGVAYAIHIIVAWSRDGGPGSSLDRACALTIVSGGTTAAGFVGMSAVPVPAIRDFGTLGGLGVLVIVAATTTLVPAVLACLDRRRRSFPGSVAVRMTSWCRVLSTKHPIVVVAIWTVALVGGCIGLTQLRVESDVIAWFPVGEQIRDDYELIRDTVSGITPMSFLLEGSQQGALASPEVVSAVDGLLDFLRDDPVVGGALGYTDMVRLAHEELVQDESFPGSSEMVAQLMLVLASDDLMSRLVTGDFRSAQVIARLDANGSKALLSLAERAAQWWSENGASGVSLTSTGIMFEYARAQEAISSNQLRGLGIAALMISGILFATCRDRLVLVAVLCSSFTPVVVLYGLFGIVGLVIDAATMSVAAVALGIAVDDSVHIAGCYGGFARLGVASADWQSVAPVLLVSTLVICAGFACLGLSGFSVVSRLGSVTASVVAVCLASDLTLLPALLSLARR